MARVTVDDCLKNAKNRFDLVLLASNRSRQLSTGEAEPTLDWENDKPTVVALREIAAGTFTEADLIKQEIEELQEQAEIAQETENKTDLY